MRQGTIKLTAIIAILSKGTTKSASLTTTGPRPNIQAGSAAVRGAVHKQVML